MKKMVTSFTLVLFAFGTMTLYQNCAKTDFIPDPLTNAAQSVTATGVCTDGRDITKPTKIFLVVDASMSNVSDPVSNRIGTDDNKRWRSKVINDVVTKYGTNSHVSFGLVSFQGYTVGQQITAHIHAPGTNQPIFSNDLSVVRAGIDDFMKVVEGAGTPTPAAVASMHQVIQADRDAHPGENATYAVILMTDGVPDRGSYDITLHADRAGYVDGVLETVRKDTQAIMDLDPNMIHINGVFYFNDQNPLPENYSLVLNKIVTTGNGIFMTANTAPTYDFNIDTVLRFEPSQCD
jgi:hypothetical protein